MKKILLILGLFTAKCYAQNDSASHVQVIVSRDFPGYFDTLIKNVVKECSQMWGTRYDTLFVNINDNNKNYPFKDRINAAIANKNIINFDSSFMDKVFKNRLHKTFIFILRHEYFHELAGDSVDMSMHSIQLNNSFAHSIYFKGLNIVLNNKFHLKLFDEACAEYMAWSVDSIRPSGSAHENVGALIDYAVSHKWISKVDILNTQKESNIFLFTSKFFNKEATMEDVAILHNIFMDADAGDIKQSIQKIKDQRQSPD